MLQNKKIEERFGKWISPISPLMTARSEKSSRSVDIVIHEDSVYWTESRPLEKGRTALIQYDPQGHLIEVLSKDFDVRTKVHEYGGAPFILHKSILYFILNKDQKLYAKPPNENPKPLTDGKVRFANFQGSAEGLIAIAEDHRKDHVDNFLVLIDYKTGEFITLDSGYDFYSNPVLNHDETKLAWLTWNHPNMPWDGTELWMADFSEGKLKNKRCVAGGKTESINQPQWSPHGNLFFVSDRTNWWNLYRLKQESSENVCPMPAEFGLPQWRFGMSTWGFTGVNEQILCTYQEEGIGKLAFIYPDEKKLTTIHLPFTDYSQISLGNGYGIMLMGSTKSPRRLMKLNYSSFEVTPIDNSQPFEIEAEYLSSPINLEFPTDKDQKAYGYYYPPTNKNYTGTQDQLPPLLIFSHGGPTGCADSSFNLKIQYWTSRGFAVLDVNYGGSVGFGRAYRERLNGQWGVVDVRDCERGAQFLVKQGYVDGDKLFIRGSSAGGFTTLAALAFTSTFSGGASYYGVADLFALANDTHKFESKYLDKLIGPLPECEKIYRDRSPLFHTEQFSCPIIFFQGAEDKIVPKNQSEIFYEVLKEKGLNTKLVIYDKEEHGFRQAQSIEDSMKQELEFYLSIIYNKYC